MARRCPVLAATLIATSVLAACGGAAPAPESPQQLQPAPAPGLEGATPAESAEPEAPGSAMPSSLGEPRSEWQAAWDALEQRSHELRALEADSFATGRACDQACRALRSMEQAVSQLCALAESDGEQQRCAHARDRYQDARGRVRVACRLCNGGPPLEDG